MSAALGSFSPNSSVSDVFSMDMVPYFDEHANDFGTSSSWHLNAPGYPWHMDVPGYPKYTSKRDRVSDESELPEKKVLRTNVENLSTKTPQKLRLCAIGNLYERKMSNHVKASLNIQSGIEYLKENCLNISNVLDLFNEAKELSSDVPRMGERLDESIAILERAENEQNMLVVFELAAKVCALAEEYIPMFAEIAYLSQAVVENLSEPL